MVRAALTSWALCVVLTLLVLTPVVGQTDIVIGSELNSGVLLIMFKYLDEIPPDCAAHFYADTTLLGTMTSMPANGQSRWWLHSFDVPDAELVLTIRIVSEHEQLVAFGQSVAIAGAGPLLGADATRSHVAHFILHIKDFGGEHLSATHWLHHVGTVWAIYGKPTGSNQTDYLVCQIGANSGGELSEFIRMLPSNSQIGAVLFEPSSAPRPALDKVVAEYLAKPELNGSTIFVVPVAVSDSDGSATIHLPSVGLSALQEGGALFAQAWAGSEFDTIPVALTTLDSFFGTTPSNRSEPECGSGHEGAEVCWPLALQQTAQKLFSDAGGFMDLLMVDAEGHDGPIMAGAVGLLTGARRAGSVNGSFTAGVGVVVFECHQMLADAALPASHPQRSLFGVTQLFRSVGYSTFLVSTNRLLKIDGQCWAPEFDDFMYNKWRDCVALPDSHPHWPQLLEGYVQDPLTLCRNSTDHACSCF